MFRPSSSQARGRSSLAGFGLALLIVTAPIRAADPVDASDLQSAAGVDRSRPIMLEFAASHCSYCELLEREIIRPMLNNPQLHEQVLIRRISLDSSRPIIDFDGSESSAGAIARRYDVELTPTLVFVDAAGHEIAERLIGVYSLDYFGGFVDQRIADAGARLRQADILK